MPSVMMMSLNVRGIQEKPATFTHLLVEFMRWKAEKGISALCIQDHKLRPERERELKRLTKAKHVTLSISFGRRSNNNVYHGGVLILTDDTVLSDVQELNLHPSLVRITTKFGDTALEIASVYAPAVPAERVAFFKEILQTNMLSKDTYAGGDWNVVEDVTLDVSSSNPLGYDNTGIQALQLIGARGRRAGGRGSGRPKGGPGALGGWGRLHRRAPRAWAAGAAAQAGGGAGGDGMAVLRMVASCCYNRTCERVSCESSQCTIILNLRVYR